MKKILLPQQKNKYKINPNCKTKDSCGKLSAQELKTAYSKQGYSAVAFCDDLITNHSELADDSFLPIASYSVTLKNYSFTLYSIDKNNTAVPNFVWSEECDVQENINCFIQKANDCGFLVCLNHPSKSLQTYHDFDRLQGLFGIEIANFSSHIEGNLEDNNHIYDRILRGDGKPPYPIASDGNKNVFPFNHPNNDSFGAYIILYADELSYESVISSLKNGNFYASTGPEFEEIYFEDGKVYIKCSPVRSIRLLNEGRDAPVAIARDNELITEAVFEVNPDFTGKFIRVDIRDNEGNFADSIPFYIEEL